MKFTNFFKAAFICAAFFAGSLVFTAFFAQKDISCQVNAENQLMLQCNTGEQQSWFSWLQGKSRSAQFHFVDLLELLSRLSPAK